MIEPAAFPRNRQLVIAECFIAFIDERADEAQREALLDDRSLVGIQL
jgi:hypothetical protein